jgi:hypothetical protein
MIKEIKYPYSNLSRIEKERINEFKGYHMANDDNIHVYYVTDLSLGAGYDIVVSLHQFNSVDEIQLDDVTKNITDVETLIENY